MVPYDSDNRGYRILNLEPLNRIPAEKLNLWKGIKVKEDTEYQVNPEYTSEFTTALTKAELECDFVLKCLNESLASTQLDWQSYPRDLFPQTIGQLSEEVEVRDKPIRFCMKGVCNVKPLTHYRRSGVVDCYPYDQDGCIENTNHLAISHLGTDGVEAGNFLFHTIKAQNAEVSESGSVESSMTLSPFNLEERSIVILNSGRHTREFIQGLLNGSWGEHLKPPVTSSLYFSICKGGEGEDYLLKLKDSGYSLVQLAEQQSVTEIRRALDAGNKTAVYALRELYWKSLEFEAATRSIFGPSMPLASSQIINPPDEMFRVISGIPRERPEGLFGGAPPLTEEIKKDPMRLKYHSNEAEYIRRFSVIEPELARTHDLIISLSPLSFIDDYLLGIVKTGDKILISARLLKGHGVSYLGTFVAIHPEPPKAAKEIIIEHRPGSISKVRIDDYYVWINKVSLLREKSI